jgi:hypothetical protein
MWTFSWTLDISGLEMDRVTNMELELALVDEFD